MGKQKRKKRISRARRTPRILLGCLIALLAVCAALTVGLYTSGYGASFDNSVYAPDAFAGKRVLVLVPHEDDDIAMAGGTIRLLVNGGADVRVAFASNGDNGSDPDTRVREAVRGLRRLGVPEENVLLLGYGDCWDYRTYKHIYHAPPDALVVSESGRTQTYGAGGLTELHSTIFHEPAAYTRENLVSDIRTLLRMQRADMLLCIDLDSHTDHCALSWLFEEALGELLRDEPEYRPQVYKGYAYSLSWFGQADFYGDNIAATQLPDPTVINDPRFPLDMPAYDWAARVRFPMPRETLSYTLRSSLVHRALAAHASQLARFRGENIINGDTVFFERRTDSLLYAPGAVLTASSGDPSALADFKLVDTQNILDWPIAFDAGVWRPDASDTVRRVTVTLPQGADLASVSLYDDCEPQQNILSGTLSFSDGSTLPVGALHPTGRETCVRFPVKRAITSFTFTLDTFEGDAPGLTEIAAYTAQDDVQPAFIKLALADASQTFLYRYLAKAGETQPLTVYACPPVDADAYTIVVDSGDGGVTVENGVLHVAADAKAGARTITARLNADPAVYDTVEVVVPGVFERPWHKLLSLYERALDRVEYRLSELLARR